MLLYLPVVRRSGSKYSRGATIVKADLRKWKKHREIGEAIQTEGKQARRGYSIQGANARRHGITFYTDRQRPQPYSKGQLTNYKKST